MSLRPFIQHLPAFRHGQTIKQTLQLLSPFSQPHECIRAYHFSTRNTTKAPSTSKLLADLLRPTHTLQTYGKPPLISQCRHNSSSVEREACAHCGGSVNPKRRRRADPEDRSMGWHCSACIRTLALHGVLPNEEQLASMQRRRLYRASRVVNEPSPCLQCGAVTTPGSKRKLIDRDNPDAGYHCRTCVQRAAFQALLQMENDQNPIQYSDLGPSSELPVAQAHHRQHPCDHCGEPATPEKKRRSVSSGDSSAGYYCRSCARRLGLEDKLPTEEQLKTVKVLRGKLAKFVTARKQKSPCQHCGDITLPGSRRRLVDAGDFSSGYYCRPCGRNLQMKDELPSDAMIQARRMRKYLKLKRLGFLDPQQELESNTEHAEPGKPTEAVQEKGQ
ncbi:uncharacterized protein N7511_002394 [Penicillium nucicola]|uniref:uncharacterized protein n=1 Tax=Penicillium nucicola TaxID=1850975 RepID=UPI002545844C|nr:uncharacterized protein N7511_002394 [Penicillium nucicola]KAJ5770343.1 hypothetical protein N7511_002394 [Penicillium nucicola]